MYTVNKISFNGNAAEVETESDTELPAVHIQPVTFDLWEEIKGALFVYGEQTEEQLSHRNCCMTINNNNNNNEQLFSHEERMGEKHIIWLLRL